MLVLVWSTFCNQFATGVFTRVSKETIILVAFLNVALYLFMSLVCLWAARPPFPSSKSPLLPLCGQEESEFIRKVRQVVKRVTFGKKETAAICFCGAAKGLVLGAPLISIMYSAYGNEIQSAVTVPIALYQGAY
jgi:sodium/bile acid cotransporter 7